MNLINLIGNNCIEVSAPCRIDCGSSCDLMGIALPSETMHPVTVNIALDLRVKVRISPLTSGHINLTYGKLKSQATNLEEATFINTNLFGIFYAILSHFNIEGIDITVESSFPSRSGLGSSGAMAVATIAGLYRAINFNKCERKEAIHIAMLAHNIENLGFSYTGLQDQLSAIFGGVSKYTWCYSAYKLPFDREVLIDASMYDEIEEHLLVAWTGEKRKSLTLNHECLEGFISGQTRQQWMEIGHAANKFASAIKCYDWKAAANAIRTELNIRKIITPDVVTAKTDRLIEQAENLGCSAKFAGAGGGGSVWAIGESKDIAALRERWTDTFAQEMPYGKILRSRIARRGLIIRTGAIK